MANITTRCRACNAFIIFMPTRNGKAIPVDSHTVGKDDKVFSMNKHISHFSTCPRADQFRKQVKKREEEAKAKPEPTGEQERLFDEKTL